MISRNTYRELGMGFPALSRKGGGSRAEGGARDTVLTGGLRTRRPVLAISEQTAVTMEWKRQPRLAGFATLGLTFSSAVSARCRRRDVIFTRLCSKAATRLA